jgi:hypothetical protein
VCVCVCVCDSRTIRKVCAEEIRRAELTREV